jgi:hypothetical protein
MPGNSTARALVNEIYNTVGARIRKLPLLRKRILPVLAGYGQESSIAVKRYWIPVWQNYNVD